MKFAKLLWAVATADEFSLLFWTAWDEDGSETPRLFTTRAQARRARKELRDGGLITPTKVVLVDETVTVVGAE